MEETIDTTFPGASDDIWCNDTSGFLYGGQNDHWHYYLKEKSQQYQQKDYIAYYNNIYKPYIELLQEYPQIVDEIRTTCQRWSDRQIDNSHRLYGYLLEIITSYQTQFDQKKFEEWEKSLS